MNDTPALPPRPANAPPAFHLLAKPTGAICNLDCAYCFFLDKEVFYPGSTFRMDDALLEQYLRQLIESHVGDSVNRKHVAHVLAGEPHRACQARGHRRDHVEDARRRPGRDLGVRHRPDGVRQRDGREDSEPDDGGDSGRDPAERPQDHPAVRAHDPQRDAHDGDGERRDDHGADHRGGGIGEHAGEGDHGGEDEHGPEARELRAAITVIEVELRGQFVELAPLPRREHCSPRSVHAVNGQTRGITMRAMTSQTSIRGSPNFQYSPKRYPPGPITIMFAGVAMGVRKDDDPATATSISTGRTEMPVSSAAATAMGTTIRTVAVLLITPPVEVDGGTATARAGAEGATDHESGHRNRGDPCHT